MAKTFVDGKEVKKWFVDGREVKKAYVDDKLVFQSEYVLTLSTNHNIGVDGIWLLLPTDVQNSDTDVKIIIPAGVQLVNAADVPYVLSFHGGWQLRKKITVENYGYIIGRGGKGGTMGTNEVHVVPTQGNTAIYVAAECAGKVFINNRGVIGSGGGGGAGSHNYGNMMGGGGAPFGLGNQRTWNPAPFDSPNPGMVGPAGAAYRTGAGGAWGEAGQNGYYYNRPTYGAAAAPATSGTINWINVGDIRGARV